MFSVPFELLVLNESHSLMLNNIFLFCQPEWAIHDLHAYLFIYDTHLEGGCLMYAI